MQVKSVTMLKRIFISFSLALLFTSLVNAQFEIKSNVLGLATNNYNGQVELLLNDKSGMELEASFRQTPWFLALSGSEITNSAFRIMAAYKYYIGGEDPTAGLYFGPFLKLKVAGLDNVPSLLDPNYMGRERDPEVLSVFNTAFFVGGNFGQKIVLNNNILIEYYGGFGYAVYNDKMIRDDIPADLENFLSVDRNSFTWPLDFRFGISLGYRFWR